MAEQQIEDETAAMANTMAARAPRPQPMATQRSALGIQKSKGLATGPTT